MAVCSYCGTSVLWGVRDGNLRFCNDHCRQGQLLLSVADQVPPEIVSEHVAAVHRGRCPKCQATGPVDAYYSYRVWSALVVTTRRTRLHVCCRSCASRQQIGDAAISLLFGWWGLPWGPIFTPVQIARNIGALMSRRDETGRPSAQLEKLVKLSLAQRIAAQAAASQPRQPGS